MANKKKPEAKKQTTTKSTNKEETPKGSRGRYSIIIEPFMVDLDLPTNELLVYAVLYKMLCAKESGNTVDNKNQQERIMNAGSACQEQLLSELTQRIGIRRKDAFYGLNSLIANNLVEVVEKDEQIEYITKAPMGVY